MKQRKTDRRTLYTQAVIKDALLELLTVQGFEKITVASLCRQAEITRATFYLHYSDLTAVVDELVDEALEISEQASETSVDNIIENTRFLANTSDPEVLRKHNGLFPTCQRVADDEKYLVEDRRGSGKAKLSCIGRDIEYRELSLERNVENVWEMVADSRTQPELLGDRITYLVSELMRDRTKFIGTPTELSEKIDPVGMERISPKKVSRLILQSLDALSKIGIFGMVRRSNGKRLIELRRAESDDAQGVPVVAPVDPVGALCGDLREIAGHGE